MGFLRISLHQNCITNVILVLFFRKQPLLKIPQKSELTASIIVQREAHLLSLRVKATKQITH
jgi:hypothetical protein